MADAGKGHLARLVSYLELFVEQGRELGSGKGLEIIF